MDDSEAMDRAIALASGVRTQTSPEPLGRVRRPGHRRLGVRGRDANRPGGPHAEAVALAAAGPRAQGATVVTTLEPCAHHGRTPPCADALIDAGVARVVVGITDPDPRSPARASPAWRRPASRPSVGVRAEAVAEQLAAYLTHRRTGRPHVVLKLAATLDGRTAAADGTEPVDHRTRGPGRRPPAPGRERRGARRGGHRPGRRPEPHRPPRRHARRPPAAPGRARPGRRTSAKVQPALELERRPRRGARHPRGEGRAPGAGRGRRPPSPGPSTGPASSTATSCTSRPRSPAATTAARCSPDPARRRSTTCGAAASSASPSSAPTSASTCRGAGPSDVHRDRRGARARSRAATASKLRIAATTVLDDAAIGDSIAVNGCCLTVVAQGEGWWEADVTDETFARTNLGDLARRRPGQPRAAGPHGGPARRPPRAGPRRRGRRGRRTGARPAGPHAARAAALRRGEGIDHRRRREPHRRRADRRRLHRRADPAHRRSHHPGHGRPGPPREPRGGHHGQARRTAGRRAPRTVPDARPTDREDRHDRQPLRAHRGRGRGDRGRRDRGRRRRRGPRERGRPHHGGRGGHPREDRLLRAPHLGPHLRADDRRAARRARHPAHGPGQQHRGAAHRVHLQRRLPRTARPPASRPPTGPTPSARSSTRPPSPPTSPAPATSSRCATATAAC